MMVQNNYVSRTVFLFVVFILGMAAILGYYAGTDTKNTITEYEVTSEKLEDLTVTILDENNLLFHSVRMNLDQDKMIPEQTPDGYLQYIVPAGEITFYGNITGEGYTSYSVPAGAIIQLVAIPGGSLKGPGGTEDVYILHIYVWEEGINKEIMPVVIDSGLPLQIE